MVFVHGGPGGGTEPFQRRFFDPAAYRIVLFDQRGAGKSRPHASLEDNTTWHLVSDMERLREELGIDRWVVFGGSWGSTLGLAYAETHPERVRGLILRGIFLVRPKEIAWFYQEGRELHLPRRLGGVSRARSRPDERGDLVSAYYRRLTSPDAAVRARAARAWSVWEGSTSKLRARSEADRAVRRRHLRGGLRPHRVPLLRPRVVPAAPGPAAGRRRADPPHPGRDRPGTLRRGVPDGLGVGSPPALAGGRVPRRPRRRALGDGGRDGRPPGGGHRPLPRSAVTPDP